jgi:monovalent cation/proton antiporter MnhG/PhaG subunit
MGVTPPPGAMWKDVLVWVLLGLGVAVQAMSVAGLLVMPNLYDRVHYLSPATSVGGPLIAGAVVVRESLSHAGLVAVLVALVLMVAGPVIGHATIRAARIRRFQDWRPQPGETVHRR